MLNTIRLLGLKLVSDLNVQVNMIPMLFVMSCLYMPKYVREHWADTWVNGEMMIFVRFNVLRVKYILNVVHCVLTPVNLQCQIWSILIVRLNAFLPVFVQKDFSNMRINVLKEMNVHVFIIKDGIIQMKRYQLNVMNVHVMAVLGNVPLISVLVNVPY